jgi:hypothetical protein
LLRCQGDVHADEVPGAFVPETLFGDENLDRLRNLFQLSEDLTDQVGGSFAARVQRFQSDFLVRLVLERLVIMVDVPGFSTL